MTETALKLERLVERLQDGAVRWDEIEDLTPNYPAWRQFIVRLRYPCQSDHLRLVSVAPPSRYSVVPAELRAGLLRFFASYAALLDTSRLPFERAVALRRLGHIPELWCEDQLFNGSQEIVHAAREVLAALELERGLLRGSAEERGPESLVRGSHAGATDPAEMLRAASRLEALRHRVSPRRWFRR